MCTPRGVKTRRDRRRLPATHTPQSARDQTTLGAHSRYRADGRTLGHGRPILGFTTHNREGFILTPHTGAGCWSHTPRVPAGRSVSRVGMCIAAYAGILADGAAVQEPFLPPLVSHTGFSYVSLQRLFLLCAPSRFLPWPPGSSGCCAGGPHPFARCCDRTTGCFGMEST